MRKYKARGRTTTKRITRPSFRTLKGRKSPNRYAYSRLRRSAKTYMR